jgi:SsrA-binding protein
MAKNLEKKPNRVLVQNRKAHFNYFLSDFLETGIVLKGTEIKALKLGMGDMSDAYVIIKNDEAFIVNLNISPYEQGSIFNHDPLRTRKLLMHKREIRKFANEIKLHGKTIIPLKVYITRGLAKVEIGVGTGKKNFDKRADIKKRDDNIYMAKVKKNYNKY